MTYLLLSLYLESSISVVLISILLPKLNRSLLVIAKSYSNVYLFFSIAFLYFSYMDYLLSSDLLNNDMLSSTLCINYPHKSNNLLIASELPLSFTLAVIYANISNTFLYPVFYLKFLDSSTAFSISSYIPLANSIEFS